MALRSRVALSTRDFFRPGLALRKTCRPRRSPAFKSLVEISHTPGISFLVLRFAALGTLPTLQKMKIEEVSN